MLANVGNAVHSIYVLQLPAGPIWALHAFYVVTSGLMLIWHLRYANSITPVRRRPSLPEVPMTIEHIETAIIGAGQAGLATAYHLQRRGTTVPDPRRATQRVGDNWRAQWDTLRLYTPARYDGLPGLPFPGPRWSYPDQGRGRRLPGGVRRTVRTPGATLAPCRPAASRRMGSTCSGSELTRIVADNVVVATGTFGRTPSIPDFALDLDPSIRQLHSSEYRRPGAAASRARCWSSALRTPAPTSRSRSRPPTRRSWPVATPVRSRCGWTIGVRGWSCRPFVFLGTARAHPAHAHRPQGDGRDPVPRRTDDAGEARRPASTRCGAGPGPGDRRPGRAPVLDDGSVLDVANVVWCTGFRQVFDWIDLPIFGADGWPREIRGVVPDAPGLFFCGLAFQYAFSSMVLPGVGRDAAYVAQQIDARVGKIVRPRRLSHLARNL